VEQPDLWSRLLLRLQSHAWRKLRGHGIAVTAITLVTQDGILVGWSDPRSSCYEPVGNHAEGRLLALLAGDLSIDSETKE
jgi:hypothetical protein